MKEIIGQFNSAKVFIDSADEKSLNQIQELCNQEFIKGSRIRIMPDVHAGAGCTIGTTMTIVDKVVPNLVGVDIGCGMETILLEEKTIDFEKFDRFIYDNIPSGMEVRTTPHKYADETEISELKCFRMIKQHRAIHSIGTLGGGNHFIEIDKDEEGNLYLVIHSGSRYLGKETAEYYQEEAYNQLNNCSRKMIDELIAQLKAQGKRTEIPSRVEELKKQIITDIPKSLAYASGYLFDDYIHDMKIVQKYAVLNRKAMAEEIIKGLNLTVREEFTTIHNYIDTESMILRKGAVSAKKGEKLLIPINMRDGSLICTGKGNEDWNCSAPHGAGRLFSRTQAKKNFTVEEFKKSMAGIFTTSLNEETLDECPMAYKTMDDIVNNISPTAEITKIIKPVYNFKASETFLGFRK
ncbi:RtcB family protein [bacterium]|nr:RtcB family protein [bacterium]